MACQSAVVIECPCCGVTVLLRTEKRRIFFAFLTSSLSSIFFCGHHMSSPSSLVPFSNDQRECWKSFVHIWYPPRWVSKRIPHSSYTFPIHNRPHSAPKQGQNRQHTEVSGWPLRCQGLWGTLHRYPLTLQNSSANHVFPSYRSCKVYREVNNLSQS